MPVFLDLDNTLVDRDGAFSGWAHQAVRAWGGDANDTEWLIRADAGGYIARADLAQKIIARLGPVAADADQLVSQMRSGLLERLSCYPSVLAPLKTLAAAGQSLVIVTNGDSQQQRAKLEQTGLHAVITGAAISGELGFTKPDVRIFEAARAQAHDHGVPWMIGDHVEADVGGARTIGWRTAWVSHNRPWPEPWKPSVKAQTPADAIALVHRQIAANATFR